METQRHSCEVFTNSVVTIGEEIADETRSLFGNDSYYVKLRIAVSNLSANQVTDCDVVTRLFLKSNSGYTTWWREKGVNNQYSMPHCDECSVFSAHMRTVSTPVMWITRMLAYLLGAQQNLKIVILRINPRWGLKFPFVHISSSHSVS